MASIRKAKKLGIYKVPKYTKDRAKLMADTRKLISDANRRLKGLNQAGYKGTWASKKLIERLDTKVLKAWSKQGKIKVRKTLTNTQLKAIQKATQQFLTSQTSKVSGIKKVKESTLDSLRATLSKDIELDEMDVETADIELDEMDVETAYEMLSNKDFDYFNNADRVGASTMWALIEDAKEYNQSEDTFISRLLNMYDSSNDLDAIERAKRLYDRYIL